MDDTSENYLCSHNKKRKLREDSNANRISSEDIPDGVFFAHTVPKREEKT